MIPTGITQNVKDLLSSREIENIFENLYCKGEMSKSPTKTKRQPLIRSRMKRHSHKGAIHDQLRRCDPRNTSLEGSCYYTAKFMYPRLRGSQGMRLMICPVARTPQGYAKQSPRQKPSQHHNASKTPKRWYTSQKFPTASNATPEGSR